MVVPVCLSVSSFLLPLFCSVCSVFVLACEFHDVEEPAEQAKIQKQTHNSSAVAAGVTCMHELTLEKRERLLQLFIGWECRE